MIYRFLVAVGLVLALAACGGPSARPEAARATNCAVPGGFEDAIGKVIALTNGFRGESGLSNLSAEARLTQAAQNHACYMAATGAFSHTGQGGSQVSDRIEAAGYAWRFAAENIAFGQPFAEGAFNGWKGSTGHRKNMLSESASQIGMGLAASPSGTLYWVMVLGDPR